MKLIQSIGQVVKKKRQPSLKVLNIIGLIAILVAIVTFSSCDEDIECDRVDSAMANEIRNISDFDGIAFNAIGDVYITQGSSYSFQIQGPENVVADLSTTVEDGLLVIGTTKCYNGNASVRIDITAPDLNRVGMLGVGKIYIEDTLTADNLVLELYGVGEIYAALDVDSLFTDVVGSGIIEYKGLAYSHVMRCSGELTLNSYDLQTTTSNFLITGIGDSYVTVANKLVVIITGNGNVYYKGDPIVESTISGNGNVINAN